MAEKQSWQIPNETVKTAHLYESDEKGNTYRCPYCQDLIHGKKKNCPSCGGKIECMV